MLTFSQCFGRRYFMSSLSAYTRATRSIGVAEVPPQVTTNTFKRVVIAMAGGKKLYYPDVPRFYGLGAQTLWALFRLELTHRLAMTYEASELPALRQILRFAHNVRIPSPCISSPQERFWGTRLLCHPAIAINFCNYL